MKKVKHAGTHTNHQQMNQVNHPEGAWSIGRRSTRDHSNCIPLSSALAVLSAVSPVLYLSPWQHWTSISPQAQKIVENKILFEEITPPSGVWSRGRNELQKSVTSEEKEKAAPSAGTASAAHDIAQDVTQREVYFVHMNPPEDILEENTESPVVEAVSPSEVGAGLIDEGDIVFVNMADDDDERDSCPASPCWREGMNPGRSPDMRYAHEMRKRMRRRLSVMVGSVNFEGTTQFEWEVSKKREMLVRHWQRDPSMPKVASISAATVTSSSISCHT